jgi:uncharacterized protein YheU (UPF0270 family)
VEITYSHSDLSCVELNYVLREPFLALEDLVELSSSNEGHDEVESELRLEQVVHTYQERMVTGEQYIFLKLCIIDLIELKENILSDRLNGV